MGECPWLENWLGKMEGSPAKMHSIRGTSEANRTNFKLISAQSPKPSRNKVEALRNYFEPSYPNKPSVPLKEVAIPARLKNVQLPGPKLLTCADQPETGLERRATQPCYWAGTKGQDWLKSSPTVEMGRDGPMGE